MLDRRHFLKHVAGAAAVALPGMQFVQGLRAMAPVLKRNHKSLIVLWMGGGPATIDLWDLKPESRNGGQFKPMNTAASGVQICEHLPSVAKQMKHLSIVRSLQSTEGDHNRGTYLMHTGRRPSPIVDYPNIGSVVALKLTPKDLDLPAFISIRAPGPGPGFLGMTYAPFSVQSPGQLPENIAAPNGITDLRMHRRVAMFNTLEQHFTTSLAMRGVKDGPAAAKNHADVYSKAFSLSVSQRREVFRFTSKEQAELGRYGQTGFGRGCLLARKLVEAGAVCVEVDLGGWDNHAQIFPTLTRKLPELDQGMASLVEDLNQRGLWKDTVVVWMGEFGRTPKINQNAGRDHWARCWSVVVGGGAFKGGIAHGATDKDGTSVTDKPVKVPDLYASIYQALGIDPRHEKDASVRDNLGRPFNIAGDGAKIVTDLLS